MFDCFSSLFVIRSVSVPVYPTIEGAVGQMVVYGGLVDWKSLCNKPDCIGNSLLRFVYLHFHCHWEVLSVLNQRKKILKFIIKRGGFFDFYIILFDIVSSAARQNQLFWRTLGSNHRQLRLRNWRTDALTTRLDLILQFWIIPNSVFKQQHITNEYDIYLIYILRCGSGFVLILLRMEPVRMHKTDVITIWMARFGIILLYVYLYSYTIPIFLSGPFKWTNSTCDTRHSNATS